jgi:hypothetical protein
MNRNEIGRELKVSELRPMTVVVLAKEGRNVMATVWVVAVGEIYVHFRARDMGFYAERRGPGLEEITDDDHLPLKIYQYLGEV